MSKPSPPPVWHVLQAASLADLQSRALEHVRALFTSAPLLHHFMLLPPGPGRHWPWLVLPALASQTQPLTLQVCAPPDGALPTTLGAWRERLPILQQQLDEPVGHCQCEAIALPEPLAGGWWVLVGSPEFDAAPLRQSSQLGELAALFSTVLARMVEAEAQRQALRYIERMQGTLIQLTGSAQEWRPWTQGLVTRVGRVLGFDRALLGWMDPEPETGGRLRLELQSGFGRSMPPLSGEDEEAQRFFTEIVAAGVPRVFEDPTQLPERLRGGTHPPRRAVAIPLRGGPELRGVLYGDHAGLSGEAWPDALLALLGQQATLALESLSLRLRAEQRAETDPLTGLNNRYFLDKMLGLEIPRVRRYNHPISLLMIDLCNLKRINDTYGHPFGDHILRETAQLIRAHVRRPDIVVRYGGDEFVVLMINTNSERAGLVRERIERAFIDRNRLQTNDRMLIHISIGLRSADAHSIEQLLHDADQAMYAQKARQKRRHLIHALAAALPDRIEGLDKVAGSLTTMLFKKLPYYAAHARRTAALALRMGQRLKLSDDELEFLTLAALLHGVGKVSLPAEVLLKPSALSAAESQAMREHPAMGEEFFEGHEFFEPIRPMIRHHHERWDGVREGTGAGYPAGLCGEAIPLGARILKIAEAAETMLAGRPWQPPMTPEQVAAELREGRDKAYDARLVRVLLADRTWLQAYEQPLVELEALHADSLVPSAQPA